MTGPRVLLLDDDADIREALGQSLELAGFEVETFAQPQRALDTLSRRFPGVLVSDIRMPKMNGLEVLAAAVEIDPDQPVILITGHGDVPLAVQALRQGAYDFIEKPFPNDRLFQSIQRAADKRRLTLENRELRGEWSGADPLEAMILGWSEAMVAFRRRVLAVAETGLDVLLVGETGTGKERVARAIHERSARAQGPFVTIHLAALPAEMIEEELFGHVAGAFPGAMKTRIGRLEHGRGGTVFLDEIGSLPPSLQVKLLRLLEDRAIQPLGSSDRVELDVRFIASTREDLAGLVREGRFRDDLLYRLNPVTVRLIPLRDRVEDVPRLYQHFVGEAARRLGRDQVVVPPERLMDVAQTDWPGNLRELKNAAERFLLGIDSDGPARDATESLPDQVERFEKGIISAALAAHAGNLKATYEALGISRKTLYEKMQKHRLRREDYVQDEDV
ncbi:sigma-54-dependent transcriptional regulator [Amaricoccus macauensis]|uniref:sigma-54-dependent transcriptional regulator n=1 Tax=Amaricoccus macauensis TaxID=57001 RepID=UPI003C7B4DD3